MVRAKLKRCRDRRHNNKRANNSVTTAANSSSSSTTTTTTTSSSISCDNYKFEDNIDIINLVGIKYNKDIGLKVTTKRCSERNCPLYGKLRCTNQARSKIFNRTYLTRDAADCNTKRVVYMIQCKKCGRQYVGQTGQSLRDRFKKHLQKIKYNKEANTLHEHYNRGTCKGAHNMMVQVLHVLDCTDLTNAQIETELKRIELLWIDRLMSEYPQGLNFARHDSVKRYMHYN